MDPDGAILQRFDTGAPNLAFENSVVVALDERAAVPKLFPQRILETTLVRSAEMSADDEGGWNRKPLPIDASLQEIKPKILIRHRFEIRFEKTILSRKTLSCRESKFAKILSVSESIKAKMASFIVDAKKKTTTPSSSCSAPSSDSRRGWSSVFEFHSARDYLQADLKDFFSFFFFFSFINIFNIFLQEYRQL